MNLFYKDGHLNDEATALFAEGLIDQRIYQTIPHDVLEHADACFECKMKVMEVYDMLMNDADTIQRIRARGKALSSGSSFRKGFMPFRKWWISAAAAVIIMAGSVVLVRMFTGNQSQRLFNKYFSPYQNLMTVKGENDVPAGKALYFYSLGQWDSAIVYFDKAVADAADTMALNFYHANALLALGNLTGAEKLLVMVIDSNDPRFVMQARWYLALCLLAQKETGKAKDIFQVLKNDDDIFGRKAAALLNDLD